MPFYPRGLGGVIDDYVVIYLDEDYDPEFANFEYNFTESYDFFTAPDGTISVNRHDDICIDMPDITNSVEDACAKISLLLKYLFNNKSKFAGDIDILLDRICRIIEYREFDRLYILKK